MNRECKSIQLFYTSINQISLVFNDKFYKKIGKNFYIKGINKNDMYRNIYKQNGLVDRFEAHFAYYLEN